MKATETGRTGRGKLAAALAVIVAMTAAFFAFAPSAFAHHPVLSGSSVCEHNGTFTVDWTVGNSETPSTHFMLIRAYSVTPNVGTTTGLTADATYDGIVGPEYPGTGTVVDPGGDVPAVTSGIPGNTTSVTLTVTGFWKYATAGGGVSTAEDTRSFTVKLSGQCTPSTGSMTISKVVTGNSAPPDASYTINYDNGAGTSGSVTVQGGESATVGDLPYGSYTLSEVDAPPGATISPNPAVVGPDSPAVTVTVTNPYPNVGSFSVTKHVTGATEGYVEGSTFTMSYDCSNGSDGTLTLADGETETVSGLPVGTTCTVAEVGIPDPVPGYEYGEPVLDPPDGMVTVGSTTEPVTVTVENPLVWLPAASADIVNDCESGGALVTMRNDGGGEVVFQIVVDGENFGPTHTVGSEGEQTVLVPLAEDQRATIAVEAEGFGTVVEDVVQLNCNEPVAAFAVECAEGGVVVTLTNDGETPVDLTVTKDGEVVATVTVGDTPVEVLVPMDEDETSTIAVTNGEVPVDEQEITYDCTPPDTVPPDTVPPGDTIPPASVTTFEVLGTQETPLPVTGSTVFGMVALAAGLILAGASLLGMARRRS